MSGFHDILFPAKLARGAIGGPMRATNVQTRANGVETRNVALLNSRRKWQIAQKGSSLDELHEILAFFEARMGRAYAFRFRDPMDHKSCLPSQNPSAFDEVLGIGDGIKTLFPLKKAYGDVANQIDRKIILPVQNTVLISRNNVEISNGFTVNYQSGTVNFATPPENGAIIKAGFWFDVKVRFDNDNLELSLESINTGRINSIDLIEVL